MVWHTIGHWIDEDGFRLPREIQLVTLDGGLGAGPGGGYRPLADVRKWIYNGEMLLGLLVISAVVAGVALIASMIAAITRFTTKSDALAVAAGTLTIPILLCASFVYWVLTMEVNDAPPGNVLIGNLIVAAVATPISLLASRCAVKALSRRALRNVS